MAALAVSALMAGASLALNITYINIAPAEEAAYSTKGLYKTLSADPDTARAVRLGPSAFKVIGVAPGTTFIYLFGSNGYVNTIKVVVERRAVRDGEDSGPAALKAYAPLKFGYMFMSYGGSSNSQYANNRWAYNGSVNQLKMSGGTPLGKTDSFFQYESYNFKYGITQMLFNLQGDRYYAAVGDTTAQFSDITLPYIHYQGLYFSSSPADFLELKVAGGARGNGYWGKDVRNDTRPVQTFLGADLRVKPADNFNFNINAITSSTETVAEKRNIIGFGAKYEPVSNLSLFGEVANQADLKAWQTKAVYNGPQLFLSGAYKNVPADFQTPVDSINMRGVEGFFTSGTYRPFSFVRLSGEVNRYMNTYLQAGYSNNYNKDMRGELEFILSPDSKFLYSPWRQDHRGYPSGGIGEGSITQLSYSFRFFGPNTVYLRLEPTKYTFLNTAESNYIEDKSTLGLNMALTEALSVNFEKVWDAKTYPSNLSVDDGGFFKIELNYNSKIGKTPFYSTVNTHYYNGTQNNGSVGEMWADVELGYQPDDDTKIYVRGKTADYTGTGTNLTDRNEKHISAGLKTAFVSDISWTGYGEVMGYVFLDRNSDGIKDEGEPGIPGASITAAGRTMVTNDQGFYSVKGIKSGQASVRFDAASAGQGYILTSTNPRIADIAAGRPFQADFGVISKSSVTGTAFDDANRNGSFDDGEAPVAGIDVVFDGRTYTTAADGTYVIYDVKEGRHSVNINIDSLPQNYVPTVPVNNEIDVKRGSTNKFDIPLVSTGASVTVRVFADKNKNKKADSGEGVAGISVRIEGKVYTTGPDGSISAQVSKAGKSVISLNVKTLPKGYVLTGAASRAVNIKEGQTSSVNFTAVKRAAQKTVKRRPALKKPVPPAKNKTYI